LISKSPPPLDYITTGVVGAAATGLFDAKAAI